MSKYRNKPVYLCTECGIIMYAGTVQDRTTCNHKTKPTYFASNKEFQFYHSHIHSVVSVTEIQIHPRYDFKPGISSWKINLTNAPFRFDYTADFAYMNKGKLFVVDVKGDMEKRTNQPRMIDKAGYKRKCWFMKQIYDIDVLTYSSGIFWKWDIKYKKLEIQEDLI